MGLSGIHPGILTDQADVIVGPHSIYFSEILRVWRGLTKLKAGKYCPRFQGKKEVSGNLRPVSLISVPDKIMEKVVLGVIEKHSSHWLQPAQVHALLKQLKFIHS